MAKRLPKEVTKFLLENPDELEQLQKRVKGIMENKKWHAEHAERRNNAKMVPCDTYGCTVLKNEFDVFCDKCAREYKEDPDAFK